MVVDRIIVQVWRLTPNLVYLNGFIKGSVISGCRTSKWVHYKKLKKPSLRRVHYPGPYYSIMCQTPSKRKTRSHQTRLYQGVCQEFKKNRDWEKQNGTIPVRVPFRKALFEEAGLELDEAQLYRSICQELKEKRHMEKQNGTIPVHVRSIQLDLIMVSGIVH